MPHFGVASVPVEFIKVLANIVGRELNIHDRVQSFCKLGQVPFAHRRLGSMSISASISVRVVADEVRIMMLQPSVRSVIDREAKHAHVISIQDPVAKTVTLPKSC